MSHFYTYREGETPLLISVPHDGRRVPPDILERMSAAGSALPDTDWHVAALYDFAHDMGASTLVANYSRFVVDLNRPASDEALYPGQLATGLCPVQTFAGENIYAEGGVGPDEIAARTRKYWHPYHDRIAETLEQLREHYGYALLWDAHSIPSEVPSLFEGQLPELNIGTYGGASCGGEIQEAVVAMAEKSPYTHVLNGRFQGGFITRHYGKPQKHVHAVQLEIAQRVYMDEAGGTLDETKASRLRDTLRQMLESFMETANRGYK